MNDQPITLEFEHSSLADAARALGKLATAAEGAAADTKAALDLMMAHAASVDSASEDEAASLKAGVSRRARRKAANIIREVHQVQMARINRGGNKPARKARRSKLNYEPHSTPYQQWLRKLRADTRGGGGGFGHSGTTIAKGPSTMNMGLGGVGI